VHREQYVLEKILDLLSADEAALAGDDPSYAWGEGLKQLDVGGGVSCSGRCSVYGRL
jgi:hypothetical protein